MVHSQLFGAGALLKSQMGHADGSAAACPGDEAVAAPLFVADLVCLLLTAVYLTRSAEWMPPDSIHDLDRLRRSLELLL